ncbi:MAG: YceI family protein [Acidimicrobiia bacterium]|nr:YceI family protein [Acidimicrobiia bacterium]
MTLARDIDGRTVPATGTYVIDPTHSKIEAVARHLMVTKVRGHFAAYEGTVVVADDPTQSSVELTIQADSIATGTDDRDGHLRSPDFLDVENHPTITFTSTSLEPKGDAWVLNGDLTIIGTTNPVSLDLEFLGVINDPWGNAKSAFSASGEFHRHDFGLSWNVPLDGGGLLVSEVFKLEIEVQLAPQG